MLECEQNRKTFNEIAEMFGITHEAVRQSYNRTKRKLDDGGEESKAFIKYAKGLHSRRRREGLLSDARSIAPKSLAAFDRARFLLNCQNGTFSFKDFDLKLHSVGIISPRLRGYGTTIRRPASVGSGLSMKSCAAAR